MKWHSSTSIQVLYTNHRKGGIRQCADYNAHCLIHLLADTCLCVGALLASVFIPILSPSFQINTWQTWAWDRFIIRKFQYGNYMGTKKQLNCIIETFPNPPLLCDFGFQDFFYLCYSKSVNDSLCFEPVKKFVWV